MKKIIYIAGASHSGTTLLTRVLGAHSEIANAARVKNIPFGENGRQLDCTCGASSVEECDFWKKISDILRGEMGNKLNDLGLDSDLNGVFAEDNLRLFSAISRVTNCNVILDSSRRRKRLEKLLSVPEIEVYPVHIFKSPCAQAGSWKRKGKSRPIWVWQYWKNNGRLFHLLKGNSNALWINYKRFCVYPEAEIRRILEPVELSFEPEMLTSWAKAEMHMFGGNRMQYSEESEIRLDESWRGRLLAPERYSMRFACHPLWNLLHRRAANGRA